MVASFIAVSSSYFYHPRWAASYPLKQYEPDEAVKLVGVHQALSGSMAAQITSLTEKSNTWATTRAPRLKNLLARFAYHDLAFPLVLPSCILNL